MNGAAADSIRAEARPDPLIRLIVGLTVLSVVGFAAASAVHAGLVVAVGPVDLDDPFAGAAVPEAIIAAALAIGAWLLARRARDGLRPALIAAGLSLLGTLYGLSVTLREGRSADVTYHESLIVLLLVILGLLVLAAIRGTRPPGPTA